MREDDYNQFFYSLGAGFTLRRPRSNGFHVSPLSPRPRPMARIFK